MTCSSISMYEYNNIAIALLEVVYAHALLHVVLIPAANESASKFLTSSVKIIMKRAYLDGRLGTCAVRLSHWIVTLDDEPS
jgi:hypothetical protein